MHHPINSTLSALTNSRLIITRHQGSLMRNHQLTVNSVVHHMSSLGRRIDDSVLVLFDATPDEAATMMPKVVGLIVVDLVKLEHLVSRSFDDRTRAWVLVGLRSIKHMLAELLV